MKTRKFARTGWEVSEIGYGMWGMGGWTGSNDGDSLLALQRAVELGCNFFDTAYVYGEGRSERLLGELVRANPDKQIYTATKVPPKNLKWPSRRGFMLDDCYPPEHVDEFVKKSLENAGLSSFDLIQFHTWEDAWLDDTRVAQQLEKLKQEKLVSAVGISMNRWEPWNGVSAVRSGVVDSVQVIYNIFDQNPEDELFPACIEHGVAVIARVPFDEGTLTGTITKASTWPEGDWRNTYFNKQNLEQSVDRAEALRPIAEQAGLSMPELALRFILSHTAVTTIIPGMRKVAHVDANIRCSEAGPLNAELLKTLRAHRWVRTPNEWSQ